MLLLAVSTTLIAADAANAARAASTPCVANLLLMRHGEKSPSKSQTGLTPDGQDRAAYLAQCAVRTTPALSLGAPTAVAASQTRPGHSRRPVETMTPLARALGLTLLDSVDKEDYGGFARLVQQTLTCGGTVVAAWQHVDIPRLVQAVGSPNADEYAQWPESCDSDSWKEPSYIKPTDACYDLVWRIQFTNTKVGADAHHDGDGGSTGAWKAGPVTEFQEGFGGSATSPCAQGLARGGGPSRMGGAVRGDGAAGAEPNGDGHGKLKHSLIIGAACVLVAGAAAAAFVEARRRRRQGFTQL